MVAQIPQGNGQFRWVVTQPIVKYREYLVRSRYFQLYLVASSSDVVVFTVRCYASAVFAVVLCPTIYLLVRHKPVLCRNDWTNRADFWFGGFFLPVPHCVVRKFGYLQKLGYFRLELCPKLRTKRI